MPTARKKIDTSSQQIGIIDSFLGRFDEFKREETAATPMVEQLIARFKSERKRLDQKQQKWEKETAPNFNVFRVLRLQRHETKLHSRFLAELLDPAGSHGQGHLFLNEFLERAKEARLNCPPEWPNDHSWSVTTEEAVTESDRLDIVVRCRNAKFIMVIENKIDAAEGDRQLRRYYKWLQVQKDFKFRNLVFLTADDQEPEAAMRDRCVCLTYRGHIESWLRNMLGSKTSPLQIQAPHLRFAIDHYLQVLDSF
jgi:hypothetical protein